jgi:cell wall-associated NlpC family hydrolase
MSLDVAIGQIDQIMNLQQELDDPSAFASALASGGVGSTSGTSTSTSASSSGGAGLTTGSGSTQFANMLAANQASAITGTDDTSGDTSLTGSGLSDSLLSALTGSSTTPTTGLTATDGASGVGSATTTSANASSQVQAMVDQANSLVGKPYVWGGGHSGWGPQAGYDCSGFVSTVLHAGGYLSSPQDTQTLPDQAGIENGPGQYVTIYDRTDAGTSNDHVIIDIAGQFYESGGGHGAWGGGGGVEKINTPSQAYLASFNRILHPEGL